MRIVADENMPFAREAFSTLGEVTLAPGRKMTAEAVSRADCLAVRSVTKVNRELLESSPVKFVGTATIGTDHVDMGWLASAGIGFASAPGCNAVSVGEYVTAALFVLSGELGFRLHGKKLGVVGVGNVGGRVAARAAALGLEVVLNDPPLAEKTGDRRYRPLEEIYDCDIITFHVPLEKGGMHPTLHLLDSAFLARLKPGVVILNTSRGPVADNAALEAALDSGQVAAAVLDVWEGEPQVRLSLLEKVVIGSPHIAGYSFDGKARGTSMIYQAACRHFGRAPSWDAAPLLPPPHVARIRVEGEVEHPEQAVGVAVLAAYPILEDDARMRELLKLGSDAERAAYFDRMRKEYWVRREFEAFTVELDPSLAAASGTLEKLGFRVEISA
ncbi:4-phosphoerythronate dehydrogenase PdxB [bacterium]|nr:4-phosphoerythronate dehydrogenase PdxB [bacterium]